MNVKLLLFVQDGCPPCNEVKENLNHINNWEKYIQITNLGHNQESDDLIQKYEIDETPFMVIIENEEVTGKLRGSSNMSISMLERIINIIEKGLIVEQR